MQPSDYTMLLPALTALPLVVSDFRRRRVDVCGLALLGAVCAAVGYLKTPAGEFWRSAVGSYLLLLALGALLAGYVKFRFRGRLRHFFGAGDALFLCAVAPLFCAEAFVRYLILCSLLALGWWVLWNRGRRRTIPFVGHSGIALTLWSLYHVAGSWMK